VAWRALNGVNDDRSSLTGDGRDGAAGRDRVAPIDWALETGAGDELWRATLAKVRRRRRNRLALGSVAATLAVLLVVMGARRTESPSAVPSEPRPTPTAVLLFPERQQLPDGTQVDLKPGAAIEVKFRADTRRVVLARGEAHFSVAKNPQQPFVVEVGGIEVRAVGTAFFIDLDARRVEVTVTEGIIAVDRPMSERADVPQLAPEKLAAAASRVEALAIVDAGKRVVIERAASDRAPTAEVMSVAADEMQGRQAWRARRVEFTRTPLAEVVEVISRHGGVRLTLADPALASVRLSGIMHVDDITTLLRLLEEEHGVKAEHRSKGEILLRGPR
jgi:transmembrane sensor